MESNFPYNRIIFSPVYVREYLKLSHCSRLKNSFLTATLYLRLRRLNVFAPLNPLSPLLLMFCAWEAGLTGPHKL